MSIATCIASWPERLVEVGPLLLIHVGFDETYDDNEAVGRPTLQNKSARAILDTGGSIDCIDIQLAIDLKLPIVDRSPAQSLLALGQQEANVHAGHVYVPGVDFVYFAHFAGVDLRLAHCDVLLGRPFLRHFKLTYDGRSAHVVIEL